MTRPGFAAWIVLMVAATTTLPSMAAFCSLRDPVLAINTLYPKAQSFRSIVRTVDQNSRDEVASRLPFSLHFNELGQHTLYLAMAHNTPQGFVHARSEAIDWGLIEIAWAIRPDYVLEGFYFQRCRDPACRDSVFIERVKADINNRGYRQLLSLLDAENGELSNGIRQRYGKHHRLFLALLRSALKTLTVTELVWGEDLLHAQRQRYLKKRFPDKSSLNITRLPYKAPDTGRSIVQLANAEFFSITNKGLEVARLAQAPWLQGDQSGTLLWLFAQDGTVLDVVPAQTWASDEVAAAFGSLKGKNVARKEQCSTAVDLAAHELHAMSWRSEEP